MTFAAGLSEHPVPTEAVGEAVGQVLDQLDQPRGDDPLDLVALFVSPHHVGAVEDIAAAVRTLLRPRLLIGCTTAAVIGGAREVEDGPGVSLLAARLPGARLRPLVLSVEQTPEGLALTGWPADVTDGTLLSLVDPSTFPGDAFCARVNEQFPGVRILGGLASAARGPGGNRLVLDDLVATQGAVCALLEGVSVETVVSQGCRPIGQPWVVTQSTGNVLQELAGRPALERLSDTVQALAEDERELLHNGLHVGLVVDEHRTEFERGDFLVRNVLGVDQQAGAVAVGDVVDVGHTVQFHVRDAASADEDLREMLAGARADAALLFTCNGRGRHLFGEPHHDAALVEALLGPLPLTGMFCAGELGPVAGRNFVHGFTASLALLRGGAP